MRVAAGRGTTPNTTRTTCSPTCAGRTGTGLEGWRDAVRSLVAGESGAGAPRAPHPAGAARRARPGVLGGGQRLVAPGPGRRQEDERGVPQRHPGVYAGERQLAQPVDLPELQLRIRLYEELTNQQPRPFDW